MVAPADRLGAVGQPDCPLAEILCSLTYLFPIPTPLVVDYIRYGVPAEQREALIAAYQQAAAQLDAAPECLSYELTECKEEAGQFMLRIGWASTAAHLQGFRQGDQFAAFFGHVRGFFKNIQEMRHYRLTPVSHRK